MVRSLFAKISSFTNDATSYIPPGLALFFATAYVANAQYLKEFQQEFIGTLLMICMTFSPGKWVGAASRSVAWTCHAVGVVGADFLAGGPHVNPAVTFSMWCLGKCGYTESYVRVAGQMAGGLVAFPIFHALSEALKWETFGGPELQGDEVEAAMSEFAATFLLLIAIYLLNWEFHFGTNHYWIKQILTAVVIRGLIEAFPTAGPAMNPMLATCWYVFGVGNKYEYPSDTAHYFVYWIAPGIAALLASVVWVMYAGGTIFGITLPIGPLKRGVPVVATPAEKSKIN
jgi:glycerol uptake facilitator-like aquaporin